MFLKKNIKKQQKKENKHLKKKVPNTKKLLQY